MQKKLTNNLLLKFLSVLAGFFLWIMVITIEDPMDSKVYEGIPVTIINEKAITGKGKVYKVEKGSDIISVTVSAPRSVLDKLKSSDFVATANMERDLKFDSQISIKVSCNRESKKIQDIKKSSENVLISIEDSLTEQFPVVMDDMGKPGTGYTVGSMIPEQSVIEITGPASVVEKIKKVVAEVPVGGAVLDKEEVCKLKILDSDGDEVDTTYLEYNGKAEGMIVSVKMYRTKMVGISFDVSGKPAEGYRYTGISYVPEVIEIAGPSTALSGLKNIEVPADALPLEGATGDFEQNVDISRYLPEGVYVVDEADKTIVVMITVEAMEEESIEIPVGEVQVENAPERYEVSYGDADTVAVPIRGLRADLDRLTPEQVKAKADLSSCRKAGTYEIPLQVEVPELYTAGEANVEVILAR